MGPQWRAFGSTEGMGHGARWWAIPMGMGYVAFATAYFGTSEGLFDVSGHVVGRDFVTLWCGGVLTAGGHLAELSDPERFRALLGDLFGRTIPPHNWPYGPSMLLLAVPLGLMPYPWALAVWSLATLGALVWVVRLPAVALAPAAFVNLVAGQTGCLIAALVHGGFRWCEKQPVAAGLVFALVALKPHLGVMIPVALAASRAWRAAACAAMGVGLLVALSGLVFGWEAWRAWLLDTSRYQALMLEHGEGLFTWMMPSAFMSARLIGLSASVAWLLQIPFTVFAVGATWWTFRRFSVGRIDHEQAVTVACLATVTATPYVFNYDLVLIAPAVLAALARRQGPGLGGAAERSVWLALLLLPILVMPLNANGIPIGPLILAAGLALALREVRRTERKDVDSVEASGSPG